MPRTLTRPTEAPATTQPEHWGVLALRLPEEWPLTDDLLEELGQLNPEWRLERGHYGELVVNMGSGGPSFWITTELLLALGVWAKSVGSRAFGADSSFNVVDPRGGEPMRNPDLSWLSAEQLDEMGGVPPVRGFWPLCPAFVIEVRSPRDTLRSQRGRMADWLRFGAQLGWLVDPQNRTVWIYRPDRGPERQERPGEVAGETPIDGFSFDFAPIWELVDRSEAAAAESE